MADLTRLAVEDGIATLTLAAPQTLNALSTPMLQALAEQIDRIAADSHIRVVILRAEGRAFSAGHDLAEMQGFRADPDGGKAAYAALFDRCSRLMQAVASLPQVVIAAVQGVATAAGCQLACSCDLIVAAETARFGVNGINLGLFCSTPAVALSRRLAPAAAFELLTTGDFLPATRAHALGMVNRLTAPESLDAESMALALTIAGKDAASIRLGKAAFRAQIGLALDQAYQLAGDVMVENVLLSGAEQGIQAFLDRRQAKPG